MGNIEKRLRLLYRDVKNSKGQGECEDNIDVFDSIKNELIDQGKLEYGDLEDIQIGGLFGINVLSQDIKIANNELLRQIKKVARGLGIDLEETPTEKTKENNNFAHPQIIITNSNNQSQYQSQHQNQNIHIEELKQELEEELSKPKPNPGRIKRIIDEILDVAKSGASTVLAEVILKSLGLR